MSKKQVLILGLGYTGKAFARLLCRDTVAVSNDDHLSSESPWHITGTSRSRQEESEGSSTLSEATCPVDLLLFDGETVSQQLRDLVASVPFVLVTIAPGAEGDPVLNLLSSELVQNPNLRWLGYLSTVGVYGDHDGDWVNEASTLNPVSERSLWRVSAEQSWLKLYEENNLPVHIFRLPGIYGPGRGPFQKIIDGTARRINKKGQVFNRAHVEDIARVLLASLHRPNPGAIYNVADDEPAPPQEVLAFAAELLGQDPPALIAFEEADMSPMGRSFYGENKRVANTRMKEELNVELFYPTYREGLKAVYQAFIEKNNN